MAAARLVVDGVMATAAADKVTSSISGTTGRQFTCTTCNKSFGYKHVLQNHERTHTGEKPFACDVCQKKFTRDHHLKTHIRLHTGEKPFVCEYCDKTFVQVANLRRHTRTHTGEKPYQCKYQDCTSRFSDSNQLKAHELIHQGRKPFHCTNCLGNYRRKHHLNSHKCPAQQTGNININTTTNTSPNQDQLQPLQLRHHLEQQQQQQHHQQQQQQHRLNNNNNNNNGNNNGNNNNGNSNNNGRHRLQHHQQQQQQQAVNQNLIKSEQGQFLRQFGNQANILFADPDDCDELDESSDEGEDNLPEAECANEDYSMNEDYDPVYSYETPTTSSTTADSGDFVLDLSVKKQQHT